MACLVDTSVLVRLANVADALNPMAAHAILELHRQGESLHVAPQNLIEFRGVATRPAQVNGLGLSIADAELKASGFERAFGLIVETGDIFPAWKAIVQAAAVTGKQVHDARLIAICQTCNISHVLTFNVGHFARLAGFVPGMAVVDPSTV